MKLLDPFAGYRLACGHPFFHIALFTGSFFVDAAGETGFVSNHAIAEAFNLLRWGHFALFMLAIFQAIAKVPSKIPEPPKNGDSESVAVETEQD